MRPRARLTILGPALASLLMLAALPLLHGTLGHLHGGCAGPDTPQQVCLEPSGLSDVATSASDVCQICLAAGPARSVIAMPAALGVPAARPAAVGVARRALPPRQGLPPLALSAPRAPPARV